MRFPELEGTRSGDHLNLGLRHPIQNDRVVGVRSTVEVHTRCCQVADAGGALTGLGLGPR